MKQTIKPTPSTVRENKKKENAVCSPIVPLSLDGDNKIKKIGSQLKAIREQKGLSPNFVAVRIGQRTTNIKRIEEGAVLQIDTLLRISDILDCDVEITITPR